MKKYVLSISLPLNKNLSQEIALDELLLDEKVFSYSRTIEDSGQSEPLENFTINFLF